MYCDTIPFADLKTLGKTVFSDVLGTVSVTGQVLLQTPDLFVIMCILIWLYISVHLSVII